MYCRYVVTGEFHVELFDKQIKNQLFRLWWMLEWVRVGRTDGWCCLSKWRDRRSCDDEIRFLWVAYASNSSILPFAILSFSLRLVLSFKFAYKQTSNDFKDGFTLESLRVVVVHNARWRRCSNSVIIVHRFVTEVSTQCVSPGIFAHIRRHVLRYNVEWR